MVISIWPFSKNTQPINKPQPSTQHYHHPLTRLILTPWKQWPGAAAVPADHHSRFLWNKGSEIRPVLLLPSVLHHEAALSSIAQSFIPLLPSAPISDFYCGPWAVLLLLMTTEYDRAWIITQVNIVAYCEGETAACRGVSPGKEIHSHAAARLYWNLRIRVSVRNRDSIHKFPWLRRTASGGCWHHIC